MEARSTIDQFDANNFRQLGNELYAEIKTRLYDAYQDGPRSAEDQRTVDLARANFASMAGQRELLLRLPIERLEELEEESDQRRLACYLLTVEKDFQRLNRSLLTCEHWPSYLTIARRYIVVLNRLRSFPCKKPLALSLIR